MRQKCNIMMKDCSLLLSSPVKGLGSGCILHRAGTEDEARLAKVRV
jgi:hypothetical protein